MTGRELQPGGGTGLCLAATPRVGRDLAQQFNFVFHCGLNAKSLSSIRAQQSLSQSLIWQSRRIRFFRLFQDKMKSEAGRRRLPGGSGA